MTEQKLALDENGVLLQRLDSWTEVVNPGPLIRRAAAHLRGCNALADTRSDVALREALVATLRAYHMVAFDYGHNHPIEQCDQPMVKKRLALAASSDSTFRESRLPAGPSAGGISRRASQLR